MYDLTGTTKRKDIVVIDCDDPQNFPHPPRDHWAVSKDITGSPVLWKSNGFHFSKWDEVAQRPLSYTVTHYGKLTNAYKYIAVGTETTPQTIVLFDKGGSFRYSVRTYPYIGLITQDDTVSVEDYPLIKHKCTINWLAGSTTTSGIMISGTNQVLTLQIRNSSDLYMYKFTSGITVEQAKEAFGYEFEDVSSRFFHIDQVPPEEVLAKNDFIQYYMAPFTENGTSVAYALLMNKISSYQDASKDDFVWLSKYGKISGYSDKNAFKEGISIKYMMNLNVSKELLEQACGSLDYLVPLTYDKETMKAHLPSEDDTTTVPNKIKARNPFTMEEATGETLDDTQDVNID